MNGWSPYRPNVPLMDTYWEHRAHLAIVDDLLLYDERIVIPRVMRLGILGRIHQENLGITKCRNRARISVWWPGLSSAIEEMIKNCRTCAVHRPENIEPLIPSALPSRPWEKLGIDLFHFKNKEYHIVVDYFSRWVEVSHLHEISSACVVKKLKQIFAQHGIPEIIMSDNGPQFSSELFSKFMKEYGCTHVTSSPRYPRSNGEVERAVRTVKGLMH
ncbi:uncharacterized protein K02A2.6-like [Anneissia japonica]|uniref:uncharacterized protein K02A2.6-like n=1 Tax=Anneissia japonica TaxID=1529436 RepID=UPI00142598D8|nr:uncharacterized protein K02A2.6-like [Anneissia japonica]